MPKFYLGLDLGGTNVKAGVIDERGGIRAHVSVSTGSSPADLSAEPDVVHATLLALLKTHEDRARISPEVTARLAGRAA